MAVGEIGVMNICYGLDAPGSIILAARFHKVTIFNLDIQNRQPTIAHRFRHDDSTPVWLEAVNKNAIAPKKLSHLGYGSAQNLIDIRARVDLVGYLGN